MNNKPRNAVFALLLFFFAVTTADCRHSHPAAPIRVDKSKTALLRFNPDTATVYHYDITTGAIVDGKDQNRSVGYTRTISLGINLKFDRESHGDLSLELTFYRVHLSLKSGDSMEVDDASVGKNPRSAIGRIMVALKDASLFYTLSPTGEIKSEAGYPEAVDRALAGAEA